MAQEKPNIIWIVCEDISPYIGAYGDSQVRTPNIDLLASEGVMYTKVYTTAGVCAPSRSSIISGMNQISIGTMHMRTQGNPQLLPEGISAYSALLPIGVKAFPEYMRENGYYTTNNAKEDYQFEEPVTVWDESSVGASYKYREKDQPFFSIFNIAISHESFIITPPDSLYYNPLEMILPMYYEDTPIMRSDKAALYTRIEQMDQNVGEIIGQLKEDGVYDASYVIFFSDHGGNLAWTKREVLERGTHIPFIVKHPKGKLAGTVNNNLVSSIDFAPSMLSLAGIVPPEYLQGNAFLGQKATLVKNKYVFAARDRMANKYDRVRSVTDGNFRYVYNFKPKLPKYQDLVYRKGMASMQEIIELRDAGKITNPYLLEWFVSPKPQEELFYTSKDPDEIHNLKDNPMFEAKKAELKKALFDWLEEIGDMGTLSEKDLVNITWWKGKGAPPVTAYPQFESTDDGVSITTNTPGASIGYRIFDGNIRETTLTRDIKSWCFKFYYPIDGKSTVEVPKPWKVYTGGTIPLRKGQTLLVNAQRIGYRPSENSYTFK